MASTPYITTSNSNRALVSYWYSAAEVLSQAVDNVWNPPAISGLVVAMMFLMVPQSVDYKPFYSSSYPWPIGYEGTPAYGPEMFGNTLRLTGLDIRGGRVLVLYSPV